MLLTPIFVFIHSTEQHTFHQLELRHPGGADQRINLAAVWVCRTGVVFCVGCVTCRERDSAIRIGYGGGLPAAVDLQDGRFFVWFRVEALVALGAAVLMFRWGAMNSRCAWDIFFAQAYVAQDRGALGWCGIGEFGAA